VTRNWCWAVAFLGLVILLGASVTAAIIEVSQPVQVTDSEYYERGQSIVFDGTYYWLFYGRSNSVTWPYGAAANHGGIDPDTHDYVVYYKRATTVEGLAGATANTFTADHNANLYLGETDAVYYDGKVWVFASSDVGDTCTLYAWYSSDGGMTWTEMEVQTGLPDGAAHFAATVFDGELWVAYQKGNAWTSKCYDGMDWSNENLITNNYGTAKFFVDGTDLYFVRADSGDQDIHHWTGTAWEQVDSDDETGPYDPTLFVVGSYYVCAYAPWVAPVQSIKAKVGNSLDTLLSAGTEVTVTAGKYGNNPWVDMWPTGFVDESGDVYLFYTSERNPDDPFNEGTGNIWYLKWDWNPTHDHYTYIQNAIDFVGGGGVAPMAAGNLLQPAQAGGGDIINVAPGVYNETLVFDDNTPDDLTLRGDPTDRPVVDGGVKFDNDTDAITGLTLENVYFKGTARPAPNERIFWNDNAAPINDFTMDNCVLDGEGVDGRHGIAGNLFGGSFTVTNCEFKDIYGFAVLDIDASSDYAPWGGNGLPLTTVTFAHNYIHNCDGSVALRGYHHTDDPDWENKRTQEVNVYDNVWEDIGGHVPATDDHWAAIEINSAQQVYFYDNVIRDVTLGIWGEGQAIQFWDIVELDAHDNVIENTAQGIFIFGGGVGDPYGGPWQVPNGRVYYNNILCGGEYGIQVDPGATGGPLDAENNWWGDPSGPFHPLLNPAGTGDEVSDNVDFEPWLIEEGGTPTTDAHAEEIDGSGTIDADDTPEGMGDVDIDATGDHTVTVAKYDTNPGGHPDFMAEGFYDVHLDSPVGVNSLTVEFCPATETTTVWFWNGAEWLPCSDQFFDPGPPGCVVVLITDTTFPSLDDLAGLYMAVGEAISPIRYHNPLPAPGSTVYTSHPVISVTIHYLGDEGGAQGSGALSPQAVDPATLLMKVTDSAFNTVDYHVGDPGVSWEDNIFSVNLAQAGHVLPLGRVYVAVWAGAEGYGIQVPWGWYFQVAEGGLVLERDLPAGWNLASVPLAPADPTPDAVYGDDLAQVVIWQWDPGQGRYVVPEAIAPAEGYWLHVPAGGATVDVTGDEVADDVALALAAAGWHQISAPWAYPRDAIAFEQGGDLETWDQAVAAGWIADVLWGYTPGVGYQLVNVLDPWQGYWLRTNVPNLIMHLAFADRLPAGMAVPETVPLAVPEGAPAPPPPPVPPEPGSGELVVGNFPNPVRDVNTTVFRVLGPMAAQVEEIRVRIFDLSGQLVYEGSATGAELEWHTDDLAGRYLANGVYLYQVQVKVAGEWITTELKVLAIYR